MRLLLFLFTLISISTFAQSKATLSGYLKDAETGEGLIGATVYVDEIKSGTTTNVYGYYAISLPVGAYTITYNYLGYEALKQNVDLNEDRVSTIEMKPDRKLLEAVEITAEKANQNVTSMDIGVEKMDAKFIKDIPQFMGEVDIIRSIQLLPGVSTVGEGATGFNVRGGNIDQNLILLDEATVFNSSHLFGFFSIFNADAVKDLTLYKGGIPARYGGRLSSVLDVRQKEGNSKTFAGTAGIGLVSSRLMLEGPIVEDKVSFMLAGRRSYGDLLLPIFNKDFKGDQLFFYDVNAKINYKISDKDRLFLSGYFGADRFKFGNDFQSYWGNTTATARWNHLFGPRLFSNFSAIYSDYKYSLGVPEGNQAFEWKAGIQNTNAKADFTFFPNPKNTVSFGVNSVFYKFSPGIAEGLGDETIFDQVIVQDENAIELAAYISNEQKITPLLSVQYGLRYSYFMNVGSRVLNLYADDKPTSEEAIIGTQTYKKGEIIKDYGGLEPRLAVNYTFSEFASVKAGYNRMRQYLQLVSNTTAATPLDIWTPAGKYIKPAIVDQVSLGYFRNFNNNTYQASAEVYFKQYQDLLDYKNNAELLLSDHIETELLQGAGRAYGLEIQIEKVKGDLTGWISYTLSRSELKIDNINLGEYYPSNYDKTHDISVVAQYGLSEKWKFGGNFTFMTGRPITYPDSRYVYEGIVVPNYTNRNGARTPTYHRLDLSATLTPQKKKDKVLFFINRPDSWQSSWTFSIYNAYARKNPYSIFFRQNEDNPQITEAYRLSIFGSVIPGITYNLSF
ncbi:TonB-dependent receptor [Cryomorpha ignava]|uniref:TonB-dependent receptor n=2 Tax=Cryomorpha ignava TaxID=101383 RepID=A0A7K3WU58_9FLAO|nr:TonB-dependent receptor [Cryomorpha ignava]